MSHDAAKSYVTVEAPINIAFIKYWGKRQNGHELVLPANDSFSITLSTKPFRSKTTVELMDSGDDELWLNKQLTDMASNKRLRNVLAMIRATSPSDRAQLKAKIFSENNFPTAAGMASSASGFCALAVALVTVYKSTADVSIICRIGSGSACRSAFGGFVKWNKGTRDDGTDSRATQFAPASHWPELNVLCAVVKGRKKKISSTIGMAMSMKTSPLMKNRIEFVVPQQMEAVSAAIMAKDFATFAEIAMQDSDALQAVCRTTIPPIIYYNDASMNIVQMVHQYNRVRREKVLGYTFDAGPNAFLFTLRENVVEVLALLNYYFPTKKQRWFLNDEKLYDAAMQYQLPEQLKSLLPPLFTKRSLACVLQSPIGDGPAIVEEPVPRPKAAESKL